VDWNLFIVQMSRELAWPITVLVVILLLKSKLGDLLPRIEKLKHKDTEIAFSKALATVVEDANALPVGVLSDDLKHEENRLFKIIDIASNRVVDQAFSLVDKELLIIDDFFSNNRNPIRLKHGREIRKSAGLDAELEHKIKQVQYIRSSMHRNKKEAISVEETESYIELCFYLVSNLRDFIANKQINKDT
jgi:hypothetical protein